MKLLVQTFVFFLLLSCLTGIMAFLYRNFFDNDHAALLHKTNINSSQTKYSSFESKIKHVFVIVEENHDWRSIYNSTEAPYINSTLLKQGAYASNYHNVPENVGELHPSEPNYILLESGVIAFSDHTFTTDDSPNAQNSTSSRDHITTLLEKNGYSWKSYQEDIPGNDCPIYATNDYSPKHNPMIFFRDVSGNPPTSDNIYCKAHIRPLRELQSDLKTGNVPNYVFITPNLQHDMHNGTIAEADKWLAQTVPDILNSEIYKKDGALFITWDEGSEDNSGNNPIGMIIESPFIKKNYTNSLAYSHASFVKTVEEIFHITPLLGYANDPQTHDLLIFFAQL